MGCKRGAGSPQRVKKAPKPESPPCCAKMDQKMVQVAQNPHCLYYFPF